ncbi:CbiX/SirB N-terminal domain-containing protein [Nocardioides sp. BP30]|uniref:sirohydrochlorin chelatase n=1 Tax=Nocardioides sp. BP30 TaxID=3036374 RepID=UPI00246965D4|nr:CbiX/SirB N-terminal domain-containing protein [Nocardioides sp. BP30]WGL52816.1 CbiX/SirB N-terminal domain-containing protein [Nocardioides sp. BP30]
MRLVTVAHGTRHATGNEVAARLTVAAGERLGVPAAVSYVELCDPVLAVVLAASAEPAVVVPLLLTTGYHVTSDIPAAVAAAPGPAVVTAPLGPDPLLAAAQVDRLLAAGARRGQPAVLAAAGSTDPEALPRLEEATALLGEAWGGPVRLATLGGLGPRLVDVVRPGDAVSPYLLSPGFFASRCRDLARASGATVVAEVIAVHDRVVELIEWRFVSAAGGAARS